MVWRRGGACWCPPTAPCASCTASSRSPWAGRASISSSSAFAPPVTAHGSCPASSPDVTLESLRLRTGARFTYEYDLNIPWRHEVRLEPVAGQAYPTCIAGHAACPPEDCGGPAGYHVRRDAWRSLDALEDIHTMADIVEQVVLERRPEVLDEAGTRWGLEQALARTQARESWKGIPFSRRTVNARLRRGEHREILHQQG